MSIQQFGRFNFFLKPGEVFATTTILSPAMAHEAFEEAFVNRNAFNQSNQTKPMSGTDAEEAAGTQTLALYNPNNPAFPWTPANTWQPKAGVQHGVESHQPKTELSEPMYPDDYPAVVLPTAPLTGTSSGVSHELRFSKTVINPTAATFSSIQQGTQVTTDTFAPCDMKTTTTYTAHAHGTPWDETHECKHEYMFSPYVVVAIGAPIVTESGNLIPCPAFTSKDLWNDTLQHGIYSHRVTRYYIPMIGGLFSRLDYLSGALEHRLVGASLKVNTMKGSMNNCRFASLSLQDTAESALPVGNMPRQDYRGQDSDFAALPASRVSSRLSDHKAYLIYSSEDPQHIADWKESSGALYGDTKDSLTSSHETCSMAIGMVGPLSTSIAQMNIPVTIHASAIWESKGTRILPNSTPAHSAPVEGMQIHTAIHQAMTAITPNVLSNPQKTLLSQVVAHAARHTASAAKGALASALQQGVSALSESFGRAEGTQFALLGL